MAIDLLSLRRQYGLTQVQLAEILCVGQSTVSRWERGAEDIGKHNKQRLLDLFSKPDSKLSLVINDLVQQHPFVSAFDKDDRLVYLSEPLAAAIAVDPVQSLNRHYSQLLDDKWMAPIYRGLPLADQIFTEYTHDLKFVGMYRHLSPVRAHTKEYWMRIDQNTQILVCIIKLGQATGQPPQLIKSVAVHDLEQE